ncbi:DivIVA domain-containing protein [Micromonospora cathayae]|uniref:DivIVA domain-containing protein n=1 Tax=Micromonospora cathayae TaxID=3028804 RepID=A0ABY7ZRG7_9ACTN|nr:DivIVA domain-containing protein [Micromonospora sp. HUAS 3]WDZ85625.1 DivIVA domain-containing protein [Micromonospora sp. HUAS 3]
MEQGQASERCGGTVYVRRGLLGPRQIRNASFKWSRFGRRGFDPAEVREFLARVAVEVADLQAEIVRVREESGRLRNVIRRWHDRPASGRNERRYR